MDRVSACRALTATLMTRSPALYPDVPVDLASDAITHANGYSIEA